MTRTYKQIYDGDMVYPKHEGYKMCCCECGLVHVLDFEVVRKTDERPGGYYTPEPINDPTLQVRFKASVNRRMTGAIRRHRKARQKLSPA